MKYPYILTLLFLSNVSYAVYCQNKLLFEEIELGKDRNFFEVTSDTSTIHNKSYYELIGNALVKNSDVAIKSNNIFINSTDKSIESKSLFNLQNKDYQISGEKFHGMNSAKKITVSKSNAFSLKNNFSMEADKIILEDDDLSVFNGSFTTCSPDNRNWDLNARKIFVKANENRIKAEDVSFNILGFPIAYLPELEWYTKGKATGFLAPTFSTYNESSATSNNGYSIEIPYFLNLAPDRDILSSINRLSTRGTLLKNKYRQLIYHNNENKGRFELSTDYLNNDKILKESRWQINNLIEFNPTINSSINMNINRVSDRSYFEDIAKDSQQNSTLNSEAKFNYNQNGVLIEILGQNEQILTNGSHSYTKEPEVKITKSFELNNLLSSVIFSASKFDHADKNQITGLRKNFSFDVKKKITNNYYEITPKFELSSSSYNLNNSSDSKITHPKLSLDTKLFLERELGNINKNGILQTLVPRFTYKYTPEKKQSLLPNFDSEVKTESYENLFLGSKFTGIDRLANENTLAVGFESEFIDIATGTTFAVLNLGQKFNFDEQTIDINGNLVNEKKSSNLFGSSSLNFDNFDFYNSFEFNPHTQSFEKSNYSISFLRNSKNKATLSFIQDESDSVEISLEKQINDNLAFNSLINKTLDTGITNELGIGFEYESCCLSFRASHLKKHQGNNDFDHITKFDVVFKGLTSRSN